MLLEQLGEGLARVCRHEFRRRLHNCCPVNSMFTDMIRSAA
jgi:hypothetical protein